MALNLNLKGKKAKPKGEEASAPSGEAGGRRRKAGAGLPSGLLSALPGLGGVRNAFVLIMGDDGAILVFMQSGKVARRLFAPSAEREHIKPFMELMHAHPAVPLYILCDMIDQSYVRHTLPPVSPLSINKLVRRRLERDFAPEDIKGSLSLGREKTGRREWNFMLISLANSDTLQQWLDPMLEMPNQCKGVYLVPVELQEFINQLSEKLRGKEDRPAQWKILVAHDKVGGFRQVVLKDGLLIFTRLTQYAPDAPVEVTAGNVEQEVQNTIEYLRRLAYNEQAGLDIFMILSQELKDLIEVARLGVTRANMLTPFEVSQVMKLPQAALSGDRFADVVISANFALKQKPKLRLLSAYAQKLERLYQGKLGLRAAAAVAACYLLYVTAASVLGWQSASGSASDLRDQLAEAREAQAQAQQRFDALGSDQNLIMRVSSLYRATPLPEEGPLDFVRTFGAIKGEKVQVIDWSWRADYPAVATPATTPAAAPPGRQAAARPVTYNITLRVEMLEHGNDRRILKKDAEALIERLRQTFTRYRVDHSRLPGVPSEQEQLVIDFDRQQPVSYEVEPGEEVITIDLYGPVPPEAQEAS